MDPNHNKIEKLSLEDLVGKKLLSKDSLAYEILAMEPRFVFHATAIDYPDYAFFIKDNRIHCPYELPSVEHEISHIVEMQDLSRICLPDWGFPSTEENSKKLQTNARFLLAATARETRVRIIQKILIGDNSDITKIKEDAVGKDFNALEYEKTNANINTKLRGCAIRIMNNPVYVVYADNIMIKTNSNSICKFSRHQFYDWIIHIAETTQKNWNIERIRHEWDIKLNIMREYMDTHVSV